MSSSGGSSSSPGHHAGSPSQLAAPVASALASASSSAASSTFPSPIQSATSPRLMPSKSRPTTALVFGQQSQPHAPESLPGDEFMLPSSREQSSKTHLIHPVRHAPRPRQGVNAVGLGLDQDTTSETSEDVDGRLTDTEGDPREGTPVLGRPTVVDENTAHSSTALESLKEIEEHDHEGRLNRGMESRHHAGEQDQSSEAGSTGSLDPHSEATLDPALFRDKLKILEPKAATSRPSSRLRRTVSNKSYDSDDISNNHGGYQKHYGDEDHTTGAWTAHRKHFFILSSAGKPIYARYGDESRISSYMGVIQALISFFADNEDSLRCINAGQHKFVFLIKSPLYLVAVSRTGESETQLRDQLGYLYSQIISVLTHAQMTRIFEQRNNFDLRGLIGGTEIFLDSLGKLMNSYPGFMLSAIQCLTMPKELRDKVGGVLGRAKCKSLLYAILLTPTQLITLLRPRTHSLHPSDLHLIFNLLSGSTTFESSESWTPICLPKFNNKSFLHAYICYIAKNVCMLLISPDKDSFFEMSQVKQTVVEGLEASGMLSSLEDYAAAGTRGGFNASDTGIPGLRHFLYKSRTHVQFTMPELTDPYTSLSAKKRLLRQYKHMNERMHRKSRPLKLLFHSSEHETMLGWVTSAFELYVAFGPLVSKSAVVLMSNKLLKWIRKQEDSLLILNSPSFEKFK
ncbi:vacuolar fusion protein MON1 [Entomortierella parvispora]|uniref:Vacuolar fusion protein MON1 n=1 Tax=Entomortierella parvispora TaxID=205924 RepID=A0A9P3LWY6_9FUNG|nr:vacuolar fusion protein MON1 [Entomortierella parvispora]